MILVLCFFVILFVFLGLLKISWANVGTSISVGIPSLLLIVLVFFPLYVATAFRDFNVGIDTLRYYYEYQECRYSCDVRNFEPLFSFIVKFFNYFDVNFRGFLMVQSFFYYLAFSLTFLIYPKRQILLCLVFVLFLMVFGLFEFGLSGIRQAIAMSLFLISIPLILKGSFILYGFLGFLAFFVHNSSVVPFLIVYIFLGFFRLNSKLLLGLVVFSPLASFLDSSIFSLFTGLDLKQAGTLAGNNFQALNFKVPLTFYVLALAVSLFIAFLPERLWVCNIKEKVSDDRFVSLCAFGVVFVCYLFWLGTSIWLVARLAFYFLPLAGVFLVMVVGNVKNVMWIFMAKIVLLFGLIFLSSYISGPQISVIFNSLI